MQLLKHQRNALYWAKDRNDLPLFLDMRLGKSLVAIKQCLRWAGDVLLIAPLSTWYDWQDLLTDLGINHVFLSGSTDQKRSTLLANTDKQWVIINPEGVTAWGKEFFALIEDSFDICILDESVFIKNPKAKITKLLLKHRKNFEHHIVMTGTPIAEQTEDVVTQMIWCNGSFMGYDNFYKWRMKYMYPATFGFRLKKGVKQLLRHELQNESFILSAKDAGMFAKQVKQTYLVELPPCLRKDYKEISKAWALEKASTKFGVVKDAWLAMLACGVYPKGLENNNYIFKAKAIEPLLNEQLYGKQVVLFSRWVKEVFAVSHYLKCPCVTGNTPIEERKKLIEEFRKGKFKYLIFQTSTACRGLDLSCVDNAVMLSNYWEHEKRKQILARMNHPMKRIPTLFIDVITANTIEEHVYDLLEKKRLNARYFLHQLRAKVKK